MARFNTARVTATSTIVSGSNFDRKLLELGYVILTAGGAAVTLDVREDVASNPILFSVAAPANSTTHLVDLDILFQKNIHVTFSVTGGSAAVGWV